jgi:hypothetical protein
MVVRLQALCGTSVERASESVMRSLRHRANSNHPIGTLACIDFSEKSRLLLNTRPYLLRADLKKNPSFRNSFRKQTEHLVRVNPRR